MTTADPGREGAHFYAVWVSNRAADRDKATPLTWSQAYPSLALAKRRGKEELDAGHATMAFVVIMDARGKRVMWPATQPASIKKIVMHAQELVEALLSPPEA